GLLDRAQGVLFLDLLAQFYLGDFRVGLAGRAQNGNQPPLGIFVNRLWKTRDLDHRGLAVRGVVRTLSDYDRTTDPRIVGFQPGTSSAASQQTCHTCSAPFGDSDDAPLGAAGTAPRGFDHDAVAVQGSAHCLWGNENVGFSACCDKAEAARVHDQIPGPALCSATLAWQFVAVALAPQRALDTQLL